MEGFLREFCTYSVHARYHHHSCWLLMALRVCRIKRLLGLVVVHSSQTDLDLEKFTEVFSHSRGELGSTIRYNVFHYAKVLKHMKVEVQRGMRQQALENWQMTRMVVSL